MKNSPAFIIAVKLPTILSEHIDVRERIPVNDQYIGVAPGLNFSELGLHQDLGIHGGGGTQDIGRRLNFAPDRELTGLVGYADAPIDPCQSLF